MYYDIRSLRQFYQSALGQKTIKILQKVIKDSYPPHKNDVIIGLGYTPPYLNDLTKLGKIIIPLMPAYQGAETWPTAYKNCTMLVDETKLPLNDETVDYVLLIHMLETANDENKLLQEIWRILKPSARVIIIVPHRLSYWINREETPFGNGRPYSFNQIKKLLYDNNFSSIKIKESLYKMFNYPWLPESWLTKIKYFLPIFGGVLIIEAEKSLLQPITEKSKFIRKTSPKYLFPIQG
ncbi:methyltransferase domain-containing protein [Bartonella sp. DGB1]|uniref:methyltransferase domain-containing protein n=1 Tax=Bartonella sp. DGB1 TaxID=3239807 RepID=UPI003525A48B